MEEINIFEINNKYIQEYRIVSNSESVIVYILFEKNVKLMPTYRNLNIKNYKLNTCGTLNHSYVFFIYLTVMLKVNKI